MARSPATATRRRHRRRHRRQQPRLPPGAAGLARHRPDRQGAAAQPGRLDRPRVELHLPGRPLPRDHRPDARQHAAVQGDGRLHRVRRLRGRPHRGADGGAAAPDVLGQGLGHRVRAGRPRSRSSRRCRSSTRRSDHRRVLDADASASSTRCAPARSCASARMETGRPHRRPDRRGRRPRRRGGPRSGGSAPPAATSRPRPWSSPAASGARRSAAMAGAHIPLTPAVHQMISVGPVPAARRAARARSPSRSSATWTRFCYERQHGADMEVGSYAHRRDPARPRGHPVDRAGQAVADRDAVHLRRLRPAARAGPRADAGPARRRGRGDPLRDQRPALADPRRRADPRRDARGQGPVVGRGGLDQGGPGRRPRGRRVDDRRAARDRPAATPTSPGSTRTSAPARTSGPAPARRSTRPTASCTRASSGRPTATQRLAPMHARAGGARRACSSRPPAGSGPFWYESNAGLLEEYGDRVMPREHEWDSRWWSPIINAEHLAMRDRAGIVDLSAFAIFDVVGPGALDAVQSIVRRAVRRRRSAGSSTPRSSTSAAASAPTSR